jgi:superfamily II DNA or RNA helicase
MKDNNLTELWQRIGKQPRPYQEDGINAILTDWTAGVRRALISLPTGTGKTFLLAVLLKLALKKGQRALFTVHEEGLLHQSFEQFSEVLGDTFSIGRLKATMFPEAEMGADIVIAMVQSMTDKRIKLLGSFDIICIDEVHHYVDNTFMKKVLSVVDNSPDYRMVGCTATHYRADGKSLGMLFEDIEKRRDLTYVYTIVQAIRDGWLAPFDAYLVEAELNISKFKSHRGFIGTESQWNKLWTASNWSELLYKEMVKAGFPDKLTLAFMPSVDISYKMAQWLSEEYSHITGHVDGDASYIFVDGQETKVTRQELYEKFRTKEVIFVANFGVMTEGFDAPLIELLIMNRPTNSAGLYVQMFGRGLRKTDDIPDKTLVALHLNFEDRQMRLVDVRSLVGTVPTKEVDQVEKKIKELMAGQEVFHICPHCAKGYMVRQPGTENYMCDTCHAIICEPGKLLGGEPLFDHGKLDGIGTAVRVVDLLQQDTVRWYLQDGVSSVGIGVGRNGEHEEADRTILIIPPGRVHQHPENWCVVQVLRPVIGKQPARGAYRHYYKYTFGPREGRCTVVDDRQEAFERAIALAQELRTPALADKGTAWLKKEASEAQLNFLKNLGYEANGYLDQDTAGKLISHYVALKFMRERSLID